MSFINLLLKFDKLRMKTERQEFQIESFEDQGKRSELTETLIHEKKKKGKNKSLRNDLDLDDSIEKGEAEVKKSDKKKDKQKKKFSWPVWRKLFDYSMKRKTHFFGGLLLNFGFAVAVSWLPLKVGEVLDEITNLSNEQSLKNKDKLSAEMLQLGLLTIFLAIFTFARFLSLQFLQEFLAMDMRNDFYKKFMENDMHFFEQYKSGELVSRLSSDVGKAKSAISNNLTYMLRSIVIIFSSIFVLFTINGKLTCLVLLIVPFYLMITVFYSRRSKVLVKERQDVEAQIGGLVAEKFSGIQLVKAYSTEKQQIKKYGEVIDKGYQINRKKILLAGFYQSCGQFLPYMGIMMVLWYGGDMVISGSKELTAGELTSFILYCRALSSSSAAIANSYTNIINGTYAVQKIFEMLAYKPLVDELQGTQETISGDIEFSNVTFKYPVSKTVALRNLSFKINDGQYVAFVGESGSGKSTIIKLIEKFYQIQAGKILFGSKDQSKMNAGFLRRQIGLVNQQATLFSGTIRDNIAYGLDQSVSKDELDEVAERAGCLQFLSDKRRFPNKYQSEVGEKGSQLSGGQKQRISIARALLRKPKIIIFDEATSALDSNSESMVQQSIQNLAENNSKDKPTIIVIAHRLSTIINANRIFVMKNGQIQETGNHYDLLQKRGYYYELIQKQLADGGESSSLEKNSNKDAVSSRFSKRKDRQSQESVSTGYLPPDEL